MKYEAMCMRKRTPSKVIVVTGSIGKTSTRDAIYSVLSKQMSARKNGKNFNLILGVSRVVLGLPPVWDISHKVKNVVRGIRAILHPATQPDFLVLEVGMTKVGDMDQFLWLKPHVIVYTRFPDVPSHVEYFPTAQSVMEEKLHLKKVLSPKGLLVLNADDSKMSSITTTATQRKIKYGFQSGADVRASSAKIEYGGGKPYGVSATVHYRNQTEHVVLRGTLGTHHMYPLLAALAVGIAEAGLSLREAATALAEHTGPRGRMRLLRGVGGTLLVDDSYNASPEATAAGIRTVQNLKTVGRKVFVLGDMLELGAFTQREHERVGKLAAERCDVFVAVGEGMRGAARVVREENSTCEVHTCDSAEEAAERVCGLLRADDVVYVKGSGGMRMGVVSQKVVAEEDRKCTILMKH